MQGLNKGLRRLLHQRMVDQTPDGLDKHDRLLARRHQLRYEKHRLPSGRGTAHFDQLTRAAASIFDERYERLHRLWVLRRRLALEQGFLMQMPNSWSGLVNFQKAYWKYAVAHLVNVPLLWWGRIKYEFRIYPGRSITIAIAIVLAIVASIVL